MTNTHYGFHFPGLGFAPEVGSSMERTLSGTIPTELGSLTQLTFLYLGKLRCFLLLRFVFSEILHVALFSFMVLIDTNVIPFPCMT